MLDSDSTSCHHALGDQDNARSQKQNQYDLAECDLVETAE
jgi:hypothetical protein